MGYFVINDWKLKFPVALRFLAIEIYPKSFILAFKIIYVYLQNKTIVKKTNIYPTRVSYFYIFMHDRKT